MRSQPGIPFVAALLLVVVACTSVRAGATDAMAAVAETARANAAWAGPVRWATPVDFESADFMCWLGPERLLVGTVTSDGKLAVPRHGPVILFDTRDALNATPLLHMVNQGFGAVHGDRMVAATELLLKHGALTDFTCMADMPMVTYASRQNPKLARLFRRHGTK